MVNGNGEWGTKEGVICFLVSKEIIHRGGDFGGEDRRDRIGLFTGTNWRGG